MLVSVTRMPRRSAGGFTLIELLLAVTLLVLIVLVSSYIFDTTMRAVSQTQASNEMNISLEAFAQVLRKDVRSIEHDGFMVFGARALEAFGSGKDRSNGRNQTFRVDWFEFLTNTEQDGAIDARLIGQTSRTFYGHGKVTDPVSAGFRDQTSSYPYTPGLFGGTFSNIATDWVLIRHQVLLVPKLMTKYESVGGSPVGHEGVNYPAEETYIGSWRQFERAVISYPCRTFRWYGYFNYQWIGNFNVSAWGYIDGQGRSLVVYEPTYYHTLPLYSDADPRDFYLLPHCGDFKIQYAMPEDVGVGPGGSTVWRDPPLVGQSGYVDPNYTKGDPLHRFAILPAVGEDSGRLSFGPGDRWPALLQITATIFDPLDRLDGGKKLVAVIPAP